MKFKCQFGSVYLGVTLFILISLYSIAISWVFNEKIFLGILVFIFALFITILIFDIKYFIYDDYLVVKIACFKYAIGLKSVVEIEKSSGYLMLLSRAKDCVVVRVLLANSKITKICISPKDSELFCKKLKEKCQNILIDGNCKD